MSHESAAEIACLELLDRVEALERRITDMQSKIDDEMANLKAARNPMTSLNKLSGDEK